MVVSIAATKGEGGGFEGPLTRMATTAVDARRRPPGPVFFPTLRVEERAKRLATTAVALPGGGGLTCRTSVPGRTARMRRVPGTWRLCGRAGTGAGAVVMAVGAWALGKRRGAGDGTRIASDVAGLGSSMLFIGDTCALVQHSACHPVLRSVLRSRGWRLTGLILVSFMLL